MCDVPLESDAFSKASIEATRKAVQDGRTSGASVLAEQVFEQLESRYSDPKPTKCCSA